LQQGWRLCSYLRHILAVFPVSGSGKAQINKVCARIYLCVKIVLQACLILVTEGQPIVYVQLLALFIIPDIFLDMIASNLVYSLDVTIFTVIYTEVVR